MYKLYNVSRSTGMPTCVFDCYDNGKSIKNSMKYIDTEVAKAEIQDALNNRVVIKLPIDADSHYNKFIVMSIENTKLIHSEEMDKLFN